MEVKLGKIDADEMIKKRVVRSGGGGAVWVPVRWLGKEVIVILPKRRRK